MIFVIGPKTRTLGRFRGWRVYGFEMYFITIWYMPLGPYALNPKPCNHPNCWEQKDVHFRQFRYTAFLKCRRMKIVLHAPALL